MTKYINNSFRQLERFRVYEGFKQIDTATKRYEHAQKIINEITEKILNGWTPFDLENIIINKNYNFLQTNENDIDICPQGKLLSFLQKKTTTLDNGYRNAIKHIRDSSIKVLKR